jgi:hypothetical protein
VLFVGCSKVEQPGPPPGRPVAGAPVDAVIAWIEAGHPVNPADFRTVDRDGEITHLDDKDVAFRPPVDLPPHTLGGCATALKYNVPLSCLLPLQDSPPRPDGLAGQWMGGWVNFDGAKITVGGLHGDPGPFNDGNGRPLEYGDRLAFGDYQCRSDETGLYCVNYPHRSAMRLGGETLVPFGCVKRPVPAARCRRAVRLRFGCVSIATGRMLF